jgi:4-diphosphocytidyl-2-C-methyl-D-erythritol kinase
MTKVVELAPAKINLTLEILGRRSDGYHEIDSLIAFASVADRVSLELEAPLQVTVAGPFADAIVGTNILDRTLALLKARTPELRLGAVHLDKELPVAAGLGGGSANAAALLRAVRAANAANAEIAADVDWHALAVALGADVAVCFEGRPSWVRGIGERVAPLSEPLPMLHLVVANSLANVPADKTARVFRELGAPPVAAGGRTPSVPTIKDRAALIALMRQRGNDLFYAALAVVPEMAGVLEALRTAPGAEIAAVSGAGPTCFAVFDSQAATTLAAERLKAAHPGWWIVPATVG